LDDTLTESNKLVSGAMLAAEQYDDPALSALCGFTPSSLQPWLNASRRVPALLDPDIRRDLAGYSPGAAIAEQLDESRIRGRHPLDVAQYVWMKTMLEGQILTWGGDRVDMANSMEARPAFLDHHLAEYSATIPPQYRISGGVEKYVLREAMRGILPDVLYKREKFAFMAPPAHTDEQKYNALKQLTDEYLSDDAIASSGLLDADGVAELLSVHEALDAAPSDRVQIDAILNHLVGVQILQTSLIDADVPAMARQQAEKLGWKVMA
jgi:asparagine synthase (glutamine-hydrolysing)